MLKIQRWLPNHCRPVFLINCISTISADLGLFELLFTHLASGWQFVWLLTPCLKPQQLQLAFQNASRRFHVSYWNIYLLTLTSEDEQAFRHGRDVFVSTLHTVKSHYEKFWHNLHYLHIKLARHTFYYPDAGFINTRLRFHRLHFCFGIDRRLYYACAGW